MVCGTDQGVEVLILNKYALLLMALHDLVCYRKNG